MNILDMQKDITIGFWSNIFKKLIDEKIEYTTWSKKFLSMNAHDNICGIRAIFKDKSELSIVSHLYSYGGTRGLFEIMPSLEGDPNDVTGYLTEKEILSVIDSYIGKMGPLRI